MQENQAGEILTWTVKKLVKYFPDSKYHILKAIPEGETKECTVDKIASHPMIEKNLTELTARLLKQHIHAKINEPLLRLANKMGLSQRQRLMLQRRNFITYGDALKKPSKLASVVGETRAHGLLTAIRIETTAAPAVPTVNQLGDIISLHYDKEEDETNQVYRTLCNMELTNVMAVIPQTTGLDEKRREMNTLNTTLTIILEANAEARNPNIRDVIGIYQDDLNKEIEKNADQASKATDPTKKEFFKTKQQRLTNSIAYITEFFGGLVKTDNAEIFAYFIFRLPTYTALPPGNQEELFKKKFYFYSDVVTRKKELADTIGKAAADNLLYTILDEEKSRLLLKYGKAAMDFFDMQLHLDLNKRYEDWIPSLCSAFCDDRTKTFYSAPAADSDKWLKFFRDRADADITYDESGKTSFRIWYKKVASLYATFGMCDYNKQQRIKTDKKKFEDFLGRFMNSPEGNAVMVNVRARSFAFEFQRRDATFQFNIDYETGNLDLFNKLVQMMKEPVLSESIKSKIYPDLASFDRTNTKDAEAFQTLYEETVTKFTVLKPDVNLKQAEDYFMPLAATILFNDACANTDQHLKEADKDEQMREKLSQPFRDAVQQAMDALKNDTDLTSADDKKKLDELYPALSSATQAGFTMSSLTTIGGLFMGIANYWSKSTKFAKVLKAFMKVLATLALLSVFLQTCFVGGSYNPMDWVNFCSQIILLGTAVFKYLAKTVIGRYVGTFMRWIGNQFLRVCGPRLAAFFTGETLKACLKVAGKILYGLAYALAMVVVFYGIVTSAIAAGEAFKRGDTLTGWLQLTCSFLQVVVLMLMFFPGCQPAAIVAQILLVLVAVIQMIIAAVEDDAVTTYLRQVYGDSAYKMLRDEKCLSQ